jgi:hypothetical protein
LNIPIWRRLFNLCSCFLAWNAISAVNDSKSMSCACVSHAGEKD